jgi:hypothetical protein
MKKRLSFICWKCQLNYSLFLELIGSPKLNVECPFCGEEGIADLAPYLDNVAEVFRSESPGKERGVSALNLPDNIPTREPEDEEITIN